MAILICAASGTEAKACWQGVRDAGLSRDFEVLRTGVGLQNASERLARRLEQGAKPKLIVSSGFAGAFSDSIALHAWVTARQVYRMDGVLGEPRSVVAFEAAQQAAVVSSAELIVDHHACEAHYKSLRAPVAVDMESASIAEQAARHDIACMVLRMTTDTPSDPLPSFLFELAAAGSAGTFLNRASLALSGLRAAVAQPREIARLLKNGPNWARLLRKGWSERALAVREAVAR